MLEEANIGSAYLAHPIIVLKDVRHQHLEALLDYMYIGEVNVLQSELASLIKAAEYLQIKGLAVPDDPKSNYKMREKQALETADKTEFGKHTKIRGKNEQSKENNTNSSRQDNNNVDNLINECNSNLSEHRSNDNKLGNAENIGSDIHEKKNSTTICEHLSSPDIYNHKEINNQDTINSTYYDDNQEPLLIKDHLENSSHLYIDENNYSKEYSNLNNAPTIPQTSKYEIISNDIAPESMQTLEDLSNDSCHLDSQQIGLRNIVNSTEKSPINLMEVQNIHKQFNILNNGAVLWPYSSQTITQGVSCPFCLKLYYRKDAFIYHYKTHFGNKPYSCTYCNQSFIQKGSLKTHIKTHTGEKPFPCPMCPKRFIQKVHLENHILTHTGEKPLSCPYCSHRFARKDILKEHISRRHPGHTL